MWPSCSGGGPEGDGDHGWDQSLPLASLLFPGESNATADAWGLGNRDPAGNPDVFGGLLCVVLDQILLIQINGGREGEEAG